MSVPFILAPMATLSHRAYRELAEDFGGCDMSFAEMIGAAPFLNGGRFETWYADPLPRPDRLVYQLVGGDAQLLARAAAILDGRGTAGIDINMGCSAPDIVRTGGGVRWMADEAAARSMIGGVRSAVKGRLSVKLRLGVDEDLAAGRRGRSPDAPSADGIGEAEEERPLAFRRSPASGTEDTGDGKRRRGQRVDARRTGEGPL